MMSFSMKETKMGTVKRGILFGVGFALGALAVIVMSETVLRLATMLAHG